MYDERFFLIAVKVIDSLNTEYYEVTGDDEISAFEIYTNGDAVHICFAEHPVPVWSSEETRLGEDAEPGSVEKIESVMLVEIGIAVSLIATRAVQTNIAIGKMLL